MRAGEWISLVINLGVGIYLAWFYPRTLRRKLGAGRMPPLFKLLLWTAPPLGYFIVAGTLLYSALRLSGYIG
jgi:hypothetical protein